MFQILSRRPVSLVIPKPWISIQLVLGQALLDQSRPDVCQDSCRIFWFTKRGTAPAVPLRLTRVMSRRPLASSLRLHELHRGPLRPLPRTPGRPLEGLGLAGGAVADAARRRRGLVDFFFERFGSGFSSTDSIGVQLRVQPALLIGRDVRRRSRIR